MGLPETVNEKLGLPAKPVSLVDSESLPLVIGVFEHKEFASEDSDGGIFSPSEVVGSGLGKRFNWKHLVISKKAPVTGSFQDSGVPSKRKS